MYGGSNMETYNTVCELDGQQETALWLRKQAGALCRPRGVGWGGQMGGGSKGRDICIPMGDSC